MREEMLDVAVIGAGQAGLAMGHHLRRRGMRFALLDGAPRVGHSWRRRWDSLTLFTPARHSALPGMPFPGDPARYPGKDEVADYLEAYARAFALPVRMGDPVARLRAHPSGRGYGVETARARIHARAVVVATGPFQRPAVPALAAALPAAVAQVHGDAYRAPADLPDGPALVVGAGNSGVQIARELAATRPVTLAVGERLPRLPQHLLGRSLFDWLETTGAMRVTAGSRLGRRMRARDVLIGESPRMVARAHGVRLAGRVTAATACGALLTADGAEHRPAAVVWATGYRPDFSWIDLPVLDARGQPVHRRGVTAAPGLCFLGLSWLHTRGSALLGWVERDAEFLADHLAGSVPRIGCATPAKRHGDDTVDAISHLHVCWHQLAREGDGAGTCSTLLGFETALVIMHLRGTSIRLAWVAALGILQLLLSYERAAGQKPVQARDCSGWSEPVPIPEMPVGQALRWPSVTIRGDTSYVVANLFPTDDQPLSQPPLLILRQPGGRILPPEGAFQYAYPKGAVDGNGTFHLFWAESTVAETSPRTWPGGALRELWHAALDGERWSAPERIWSGRRIDWGAEHGALAVDQLGGLHVAVPAQLRDGYPELVYLRKTHGRWSDTTFRVMASYASISPSREALVIVYVGAAIGARSDLNSLFQVSSSDNGMNWTSPAAIHSSDRGAALSPQLAARRGRLHLVWREMSTAGSPETLHAWYSDTAGETWTHSESFPLTEPVLTIGIYVDPTDSVTALVQAVDGNNPVLRQVTWKAGKPNDRRLFSESQAAYGGGIAWGEQRAFLVASILGPEDESSHVVAMQSSTCRQGQER